MKMNKKIIVSTLALAMGAALAGSVSGTVAWFQYSTRAQASYIGSTVHCSENLQMKVNGTWGTEFSALEMATAAGSTGTKLEPVTTGTLAAGAALPTQTVGQTTSTKLYKNPVYQYFTLDQWAVGDSTNYVQFDLNFRILDVDGAGTANYLSGKLYLADLSIVSLDKGGTEQAPTYSENTSSDLYKAVRVHIATPSANYLYARGATDGNETIETITYGALDLNNDGNPDKTEGYEWSTRSEGVYGAIKTGSGENVQINNAPDPQVAYNVAKEGVLANDTDLNNIDGGSKGTLGTIEANADGGFAVKVTIWLEGWQKLGAANSESAIWDPAVYANKSFGVGFRFATDLHNVNHQ